MNLSLPVFCEFYKFFIVEEIALETNIDKIHYGKCSIIGYLSSLDCLQSLTIQNFEKKYQLPDGAVSLKLFNDNPCSTDLIGSTVQVFGEVRLFNPELKITYDNLESSNSLIHRLLELKSDLETESDDVDALTKRIEDEKRKIRKSYLPIIQVHNVRAQRDAKEMIVENFQFRLLLRRRDEQEQERLVPNS